MKEIMDNNFALIGLFVGVIIGAVLGSLIFQILEQLWSIDLAWLFIFAVTFALIGAAATDFVAKIGKRRKPAIPIMLLVGILGACVGIVISLIEEVFFIFQFNAIVIAISLGFGILGSVVGDSLGKRIGKDKVYLPVEEQTVDESKEKQIARGGLGRLDLYFVLVIAILLTFVGLNYEVRGSEAVCNPDTGINQQTLCDLQAGFPLRVVRDQRSSSPTAGWYKISIDDFYTMNYLAFLLNLFFFGAPVLMILYYGKRRKIQGYFIRKSSGFA